MPEDTPERAIGEVSESFKEYVEARFGSAKREPVEVTPQRGVKFPFLPDPVGNVVEGTIEGVKTGFGYATGFARNALEDGYEILEGLVKMFPLVVRSGTEVVTELAKPKTRQILADNPGAFFSGLADSGNELVRAVVEPYREHGVGILYKKPVTSLLDALTVASLGGGAMTKIGRLSGNTALTKAGSRVTSFGNRAWEAGLDQASRFVGVNRKTRLLALRHKAHEYAKIPIEEKRIGEPLYRVLKTMDEDEGSLLDKILNESGTAEELTQSKNVESVYRMYEQFLEGFRERLIREHGLMTSLEMDEARVKKVAANVFGNLSDDALKEARKIIESAEVKPLYTPAIFDEKGFFAFQADELFREPRVLGRPTKTGKVRFLERFKGAPDRIEDPRKYLPASIRGFLEHEAKLKWVDNVLQDDLLVFKAAKDVPEAVQLATMGALRKYWRDPARAQAVYRRNLVKAFGHEKANELLLRDPKTRAGLAEARSLVADPTVAKLMNLEFTTITGRLGNFLRIYDGMLNLFRGSATVLNPRWYTGNVIGDALLSVIAGVTLGPWRAVSRMLNELPAEVRPVGRYGITGVMTGGMAEKLRLTVATDFVNQIDGATRAGILTADVSRRLKDVGVAYFNLDLPFEDALRKILGSVNELAKARHEVQLLQEHIARNTPQITRVDRVIDRAQKRLARLEDELAQYALPEAGLAPGEARLNAALKNLDERYEQIMARKEVLPEAERAARAGIGELSRQGKPGAARKVEKALRVQRAAEDAYLKEILREIKQRGGVAPSGLVSTEQWRSLPKSLRSKKGVQADELAQELYDRGIIKQPYTDDLYDFIEGADGFLRRPGPTPQQIQAMAAKMVAERSSGAVRELVDVVREHAAIKNEITKLYREKVSGLTKKSEILKARSGRIAALEDAAENTKAKLAYLEKIKDDIVGDLRTTFAKEGALLKNVPELKKMADFVAPSIQRANDFIGNYLGMGPLERMVFRRMVPFYAWCVDEQTECLTESGWKRREDLTVGMKILAMDHSSGEFAWQPIKELATFDYKGVMFSYERSTASILCTPDHRWPIEKRSGKKSIDRAWQLDSGDGFVIRGDYRKAESILSDRDASILGWVITDGYVRTKGKHTEAIIYQSPKKHLKEILDLVGSDGTRGIAHPDTGVVPVRLKSAYTKTLLPWVSNKDLIPSLLPSLSRSAAEAMWEAMMKAEGSRVERNDEQSFTQKKGPVADAFQILCLLTGRSANMHERSGGGHGMVNLHVRKSAHSVYDYRGWDTVWHDGIVWCPVTDWGTWVMRRNGKVLVTGNTKAMNMLLFHLPIMAPKQTFFWHRYQMVLMDMVGDPELPEYLQGYAPVFTRENGDLVWMRFSSLSPFHSARPSKVFGVPVPGIVNFLEANPFISTTMKGVGLETQFDRSWIPFEDGEPLVKTYSGDRYEFRGGRIIKTIPQAPLQSSLAHLFPIVQMLENAVYPYYQTRSGWLLNPEPVLNPDGSYKYPKELWQRLVTFLGAPVTVAKRGELIRRERAKVKQTLTNLKGLYRRSSPEDREHIRGVFKDYVNGEYRRIRGY